MTTVPNRFVAPWARLDSGRSRPRQIYGTAFADLSDLAVAIRFEPFEVPAKRVIERLALFEIDSPDRSGLVHDPALGHARDLHTAGFGDGRPLVISERRLDDARFRVLLAETLHHEFEGALRGFGPNR